MTNENNEQSHSADDFNLDEQIAEDLEDQNHDAQEPLASNDIAADEAIDLDENSENDLDNVENLQVDSKKESKKSTLKSPLATQGKPTASNKVFVTLVVLIFLVAAFVFVMIELRPHGYLEDLALEDPDQINQAVTFFDDSKNQLWLENRLDHLLSHSSEKFQRFGCRALTNWALALDNQDRIQAVERLTEVLNQPFANDLVQTEIIRNLGRLARSDLGCLAHEALAKAVNAFPQDGKGLDRDNRYLALQELDSIEDLEAEKLMVSLISELQDLQGLEIKISLYQLLSERFVAATSNFKKPHKIGGEIWEHQINVLGAILEGYRSDSDQRVRHVCWQAWQRLTSPRALELWVHQLNSKESNDLEKTQMDRTVALTMLRRVSGQVFGYDLYDESADVGSWKNWVRSAKP